MEREVLLIGRINSFIVNAAGKGLEKEGFAVRRTAPDITAIDKARDETRVWVFYLTGGEDINDELLVYLRDHIAEEHVLLTLIGNPDELKDVQSLLPEEEIANAFERPLDVHVLAESLERAFSKVEKDNEKKRILIVDDSAQALKTMKGILSDRYLVYMANSGVSAITFLAKTQVDLILLDYEMPVVDGPKVLEMIKSEPSIEAPPVMFLTAKGDKHSVMTALALKPVNYLLKSMPPEELIKTIDEFFEKR